MASMAEPECRGATYDARGPSDLHRASLIRRRASLGGPRRPGGAGQTRRCTLLTQALTSPADFATLDLSSPGQRTLYLALAALALLVALLFVWRALAPVAVIIQAVAGAAVVAFAITLARALVTAAALSAG